MQNTKLTWNNSPDELITALDNAISSIEDALEEIRGYGELFDLFAALDNDRQEMEREKDRVESYASGEYQAELAEMAREYYRSVM